MLPIELVQGNKAAAKVSATTVLKATGKAKCAPFYLILVRAVKFKITRLWEKVCINHVCHI